MQDNAVTRWQATNSSKGLCRHCTRPVARTQGSARTVCQYHLDKRRERMRRDGAARYTSVGHRANVLHWAAKKRADNKGVAYTLDREWFEEKILGGVCEVTGLPFVLTKHEKHATHPMAPSVDRITAGGPYSKDNCRMVVLALNAALNQWGEEAFTRLAEAYLARKV